MIASAVRPSSTFSKDFSSKTTGPISLKFLIQTPANRGKESLYIWSRFIYIWTKMTAMPIYGINLKTCFWELVV